MKKAELFWRKRALWHACEKRRKTEKVSKKVRKKVSKGGKKKTNETIRACPKGGDLLVDFRTRSGDHRVRKSSAGNESVSPRYLFHTFHSPKRRIEKKAHAHAP